MSVESYYLGTYWPDRKQSAEDCARRTMSYLLGLAGSSSLFSSWYELGRSRKDALRRPLMPELEHVRRLLERGRNHYDSDGSIIEELGYSISLWNGGRDGESVGLRINCGRHSSGPGHRIPNSCVLSLPSGGAPRSTILQADLLVKATSIAARAFEPAWGAVLSDDYMDIVKGRAESDRLHVGWITYLPVAMEELPPLPDPAKASAVGRIGTIIVATPEIFTAANPSHVALVLSIWDRLKDAGIVRS